MKRRMMLGKVCGDDVNFPRLCLGFCGAGGAGLAA